MPADNGITVNLPTVDWAQLIPQLIGLFFDGIGTYLNNALHAAFDGLWHSGINVVGQTDLAMTWNFGPVHDQVVSVQGAAQTVLVFALVLLGLKSMLGGIVSSHRHTLDEFVNGVLMAVILVAAFPLLVPQVIGLVNQAATAIGTADLSRYIVPSVVANPMLQLVLFVILLFFGLRLLIKAAWRIGFLAVLLPFGLAACALYAIPQTRWILGWWARVWGGMLVAQLPSVLALTIGAQFFAFDNGGLGAFVFSIAFLQLATDLYSLIPFGHVGSSGAPWGSLPWRVPLALLGSGPGRPPLQSQPTVSAHWQTNTATSDGPFDLEDEHGRSNHQPIHLELRRFCGHLSIGGGKPPTRSPDAENTSALPARVPSGSG